MSWRDLLVTLSGFVIALVTALTAWWSSKRKADVDESALVLGEWKKLIEAHQNQIRSLVEEIADLRKRLGRAEDRITALEDENRGLRTENDGLKRQVAQRSQSEVEVLGPVMGARAPTSRKRFLDPDIDLIEKLNDETGK